MLVWIAALLLAWLPHLWIQLSTPAIVGIDGYYHIRYTQLLRLAGSIKIPFPWLPTTILNPAEFTDHHLLFHILSIPFTLGDLVTGAKLAAVVFASAATLVWFLVARAEGVRYPLIWLVALIGSSDAFLYRMAMARRQSLTLLLMLIAVHLMLTRRIKLLVAVGFAFVWLYDGWPMLILVVGIASLGRWLEHRRIDMLPGLAAFGGVVLGTVLNPFFPNSAVFPLRHLAPKLALSHTYSVRVGGEWYPYDLADLFQNAGVAVMLPFLGLAAVGWTLWQRRAERGASGYVDARVVAWGGCAFLFLALLVNSKRFVEYEPAFATLFAAVAISGLLNVPRAQDLLARIPDWLRPTWFFPLILVMLLAFFPSRIRLEGFVVPIGTVFRAYDDTRLTDSPTRYGRAATWLAQNALPGERVFSTDWDDFPRLYFYNTRNVYFVGLDPNYMAQYDFELYSRWREIGRGEVAQPGAEIRDRFNARWIFSDLAHSDFLEQADADPRMRKVYADNEAVVYFVRPDS